MAFFLRLPPCIRSARLRISSAVFGSVNPHAEADVTRAAAGRGLPGPGKGRGRKVGGAHQMASIGGRLGLLNKHHVDDASAATPRKPHLTRAYRRHLLLEARTIASPMVSLEMEGAPLGARQSQVASPAPATSPSAAGGRPCLRCQSAGPPPMPVPGPVRLAVRRCLSGRRSGLRFPPVAAAVVQRPVPAPAARPESAPPLAVAPLQTRRRAWTRQTPATPSPPRGTQTCLRR